MQLCGLFCESKIINIVQNAKWFLFVLLFEERMIVQNIIHGSKVLCIKRKKLLRIHPKKLNAATVEYNRFIVGIQYK